MYNYLYGELIEFLNTIEEATKKELSKLVHDVKNHDMDIHYQGTKSLVGILKNNGVVSPVYRRGCISLPETCEEIVRICG